MVYILCIVLSVPDIIFRLLGMASPCHQQGKHCHLVDYSSCINITGYDDSLIARRIPSAHIFRLRPDYVKHKQQGGIHKFL